MMEELTDDYRQHLLDLCEATDLTNDFSAWKLAQEAKAAIPLLVAEVRRLRGALASAGKDGIVAGIIIGSAAGE